jgi:hypothetical protein
VGGRRRWAGGWATGGPPPPRPREGLGWLRPPKNNRLFIAALCGAAAWTANVNIRPRRGGWGNRVSPYLSGCGPEARAPRPPPAGGSGRAQPVRRGMGAPGSPILPPAGGFGRAQPVRRGLGQPGFPIPHPVGGFGRAQPVRRGLGQPGFPIPHPVGGSGRAQPARRGMGAPGSPILPPAGGFGRAQPSQEQPSVHCGVVRCSRMDG